MTENTTTSIPAELEQRAEAGDAKAQFELACHYAYFENVERNLDLASMWLIKAAEQGLTEGELAMGYRHYFHREERVVRAESEWIREYAVEAYVGAMVCEEASPVALGFCLAAEKYPNIEVAISWFGKVAAKGNAEAQFFLARCYFREGSSHNFKLASDWLAKALDQGWNLPMSFLANENIFDDLKGQDFLQLYDLVCLANKLIRKKKQAHSKQSQSFDEFSAEGRFEKTYSKQRLNELEARAFEIYFNDVSFTQNEQLISIWQTALAESGLAKAQYRMAQHLFSNKGQINYYVPRFLQDIVGEEIRDGFEFFRKKPEYLNIQLGTVWMAVAAYEGKHPGAQDWLTKEFLAVVFPALKGKQNVEEYYKFAFEWCNENAKSANTMDVNLALGILHFTGAGVGEPITVKALEFFSRAKYDVGMELEDDIFGMYADKAWFMEGICRQFFCHGNGLEEKPRVPWYRILSFFLDNLSPEHKERVILPTLNFQLLIRCGDFELAKEKIEDWFVDKNIYLSYVDHAEKHTQQLNLEIQQKKLLELKMQKLVEQFTHTLGNVIFPDTIYQVAERLKSNPDCRKDVLLLNEAYHSEIIIKLHGELLRRRHANYSPLEFLSLVRSGRATMGSGDKTKSISDILDYAASRVTARFLNQHNASLGSIRDKILGQKNVSLDALRQQFEDDILLNKTLGSVEWINQYLRPFEIVELSPLWQRVYILAESHAEALLFGYFSEVLFNAFKYADHESEKFLTVCFDETIIDGKTYLSCSWSNPMGNKSANNLGTGKGLDAILEDLQQLNETDSATNSMLVTQDDEQFQVTMFFQKYLLISDAPKPPKFPR